MPVPEAITLPPHDTQAERRLLAGLMREPVLVGAACRARGVGSDDLYHHPHRLVWRVVAGLAAGGFETGPAAVFMVMRAGGELPELGARPALWLAEVWEEDPTGAWCDWSAGVVKEASLRRAVIHRADEMKRAALDGIHSPEEYARQLG